MWSSSTPAASPPKPTAKPAPTSAAPIASTPLPASSQPAATPSAPQQELAAIPGVSAVIGNSHKALAPEIALQLGSSNEDAGESTGHNLGRVANADERQGASAPDGPPPIVSISTLLAASANQPLILADDTFAHSFLDEAPVVPRRPDPPQSQNPGRLLQPLLLLRNPPDPRQLSQPLQPNRFCPTFAVSSRQAATNSSSLGSTSAAGAASLLLIMIPHDQKVRAPALNERTSVRRVRASAPT